MPSSRGLAMKDVVLGHSGFSQRGVGERQMHDVETDCRSPSRQILASWADGSPPAPVSVVIPCFQCAGTIRAAVESVAAQTLRPMEVLLVDDASGDDTIGVLEELACRYPAGWIKVLRSQRNGGPSAARNLGWEHASQEYIAFLDSDDSWLPPKLQLQMQALRADPSIALLAHRMEVRERGAALPAASAPLRVSILGRRRLLWNNPFPTASVVLRRDLPFRFNENFRRVEDFLLWSQIAFSGYRCAKINRTLAFWHKATYGAGGLSGDLAAMHRAGRQVRQELLRQGLVSPAEHWLARILGTIRRTRRVLLMKMRQLTTRQQVSP